MNSQQNRMSLYTKPYAARACIPVKEHQTLPTDDTAAAQGCIIQRLRHYCTTSQQRQNRCVVEAQQVHLSPHLLIQIQSRQHLTSPLPTQLMSKSHQEAHFPHNTSHYLITFYHALPHKAPHLMFCPHYHRLSRAPQQALSAPCRTPLLHAPAPRRLAACPPPRRSCRAPPAGPARCCPAGSPPAPPRGSCPGTRTAGAGWGCTCAPSSAPQHAHLEALCNCAHYRGGSKVYQAARTLYMSPVQQGNTKALQQLCQGWPLRQTAAKAFHALPK